MKRDFTIVLLFIFTFTACNQGRSDYELLQSQNIVKNEKKKKLENIEYKIVTQDRLSIVIYQYPEITPTKMNEKGILVDSQGYISLPLIHRVKIAGYTQSDAARMLEEKYKKYLTDPSLNIEVMNKRAYILGEVKKAGVIRLENETMSVIQAVATAGGLTDSAQRDQVFVITHDGDNTMRMRRIDLTSFTVLQASNLLIKPNDIIYVQPNKWKSFRVASDDFTSPFETIAKVASPFVTLKYLTQD